MCGHWAAWAFNTQPQTRFPPSFVGMDDLTTEGSFDWHATRIIDVHGLSSCYPWVLEQPGIGRRPVTSARIRYLFCRCEWVYLLSLVPSRWHVM